MDCLEAVGANYNSSISCQNNTDVPQVSMRALDCAMVETSG
jgi:hypothetical protein